MHVCASASTGVMSCALQTGGRTIPMCCDTCSGFVLAACLFLVAEVVPALVFLKVRGGVGLAQYSVIRGSQLVVINSELSCRVHVTVQN